MEKIKTIHISSASHSFFGTEDLERRIIGDWYSFTAQQIKKYHPEIEIECWCCERSYKEKKEFIHADMKYRQFPTVFSPQYGLDLSLEMLKEMKKEIKMAKEGGYKLIFHMHEYHNLMGIIIFSSFKKEKINLIAQHHGGSCPLEHLKEKKKFHILFPIFLIAQIYENLFLKNIKYFYPLSKKEIDYLERRAPKSTIRFQTMGVDDYYYTDIKKDVARKKLGWPLNKKIILYLGRVGYIKGTNYLIEAMKKLKDVDLKLIGWLQEKEFAKELELSKKLGNVEYFGAIFGEDKLLYTSACDAFVLPSTKEGASVVAMEALARNLPVISTDVGGMKLVIEDRKNGIIIPPRDSDAIVGAVREILKWKKKNFRRYAEKYRWKKIVEDTVEDYKKI
ncbi:D-inositol-3-phosphate glycosyltransferase [uncultured archaeon]|nr:D-inositol-3-phosphate glycosyltransferase [uncultured archaeon]